MEFEFSLGTVPSLLVSVAAYVYIAFSLMTIANKLDADNSWWAWIPILNIILMLQLSEKPIWWIILALIPCVNLIWIVLGIMVWMRIAEKRGFPNWWGILIIVPFVNLIVPGYLAFAEPS